MNNSAMIIVWSRSWRYWKWLITWRRTTREVEHQ